MARRLTDTYFVRYSIKISEISADCIKKDVNRDGAGVFEISEYKSIIPGIIDTLDNEIRAAYRFCDIIPSISELSIKEITPL